MRQLGSRQYELPFCPHRSFFATESAFLGVIFSFNLLSEFQRAIDPALKTYKQPATLRFEVFT
jgi:hypothetical protein